jgi:hypothetical protein
LVYLMVLSDDMARTDRVINEQRIGEDADESRRDLF